MGKTKDVKNKTYEATSMKIHVSYAKMVEILVTDENGKMTVNKLMYKKHIYHRIEEEMTKGVTAKIDDEEVGIGCLLRHRSGKLILFLLSVQT